MKAICPMAFALSLAATSALAGEPMYRSVMPDGSVRYGELPEPGARAVRKIPPPPASTGTITVTPDEKNRYIELPQGGTVVIPPPNRKAPEPATQGRFQSPTDLPQRKY